MGEVIVSRPKLHDGQKEIMAQAKRFNVVCNGRRWGKTVLALKLIIDTILEGQPVAYFVPTFDFGDELWNELKERLEPLIKHKNESRFTIRFITGSTFKMWSLEKKRAGRSRKYKRVVVDECAFGKDLKQSWERAIRATLADLEGDAWFLSTPDGTKNYFFDLFKNEQVFPDSWKSFQMPTETNPYISKDEIEELRLLMDDLTFDQEILAKFVDFNSRPFAYSFDKAKHVKPCGPLNKNFYVDLSFDFNVDPITCLVAQHAENRSLIKIHKEYRLRNSDIYKLCERIKVDLSGYTFRITGDASGHARHAGMKDNLTYYIIIKNELELEPTAFKVPSVNPTIKNSRGLTNSLLSRHPNLYIDPSCKYLIEDLTYVETDDHGNINKKKDARLTHLLDTLRYYFNAHFSDFIRYKF